MRDESTSPLFRAVAGGSIKDVKSLLERSASVHQQNAQRETPLHIAALRGDLAIAELLVERGASVHASDMSGCTPLFRAVEGGHQHVVRWLVACGASVDRSDDDSSDTALFRAAARGNLEMVKLLVGLGASIEMANRDDPDRWQSVRSESAEDDVKWEDVDDCDDDEEESYVDEEESYVDEEADEDDGDSQDAAGESAGGERDEGDEEGGDDMHEGESNAGGTPDADDDDAWKSALISAAKGNQLHVATWLLENGASINLVADGTCALVCAAQEGYTEMVRLLLESGADVASKNDRGRSPLFFAAYRGDADVLQLLAQHGARFDEKDVNGRTPLSLAAAEGNADMVRLLVACGALVDERDADGKTAFFNAAKEGLLDMLALFLELGASIDAKDDDGRTPLFYAALDEDKAVAEYLLQHGASIDERDSTGKTPLACVAHKSVRDHSRVHVAGSADMVQLLLQHSASVDASDDRGWTPLLLAVEQGNATIVDVLLSSGANINHASAARETALTIAGSCRRIDAFEMLIRAGASVNVRDEDGETPLVSAARSNSFARVQLLVRQSSSHTSSTTRLETPLILGTLDTMQDLCAAANEFEQMFERVVQRLQDVYSQMQAAETDQATWITFATVIFRVCRLQLQCMSKCPVLRFASSRTASAAVQSFHEEIDHFMSLNGFASTESVHVDWEARWEDDWKRQRKEFEENLQDDAALMDGLSSGDDMERERDRVHVVARLRYEMWNRTGKYAAEDIQAMESVMARLQKATGIDDSSVPPWYISDDDVDDIDERTTDEIRRCKSNTRARGTWLKTDVMVSSFDSFLTEVKHRAPVWFPLSHPNVVKLYGACHTGKRTFFVFELCRHKSLLDFLKLDENCHVTWEKLHDVARGIQYLHQRGIVHGDLRCDNVLVGVDATAKIGGFGEDEASMTDMAAWRSPELFRGDPPSFASDIYAFGMCILEAFTLERPWGTDANYIDITMDVRRGRLPPRPKDLEQPSWELVKRMCACDPDERVKIAHVVQQLEALAEANINAAAADGTQAVAMDSSAGELKTSIIPRLGATIENALKTMKIAVTKFPESQQMAEQVLGKLVAMYERLLDSQKSPVDVEVAKYCDVLLRFQRYLRTPASELSVARYARSRKIADSSHLFQSDLDRLMDALLVLGSDPLRTWGSTTEARDESDESVDETAVKENQLSDAIALVEFSSSPLEQDTPASATAAPTEQPWLLPLSELIFDEDDRIGEGAFGAVYKGTWLDTPIVVKFMGYEEDRGTSSTRLFLHEVNIWHQLNHPHIVKLYGANHVGKRYFVCEYAPGGSLPDYLKRSENSSRTWQKVYETALGLEYLHGLNVIHNDLKCDNILIGADGRAKLIDFGLSSVPNVAEIQVDVKRMGALHWKSPEYLAGERPAFASDVYSLAMCILEVVTGDIPWGRAMSPTMVKLQVKRGRLPPRPTAMDATQWNLFELMTERDPKKRVRIAFVVDKLREIAQEEASGGIP